MTSASRSGKRCVNTRIREGSTVPTMTHLSSQSKTELTESQYVFQLRFATMNLPYLTRKSRQSTNWPQAGERRRGSQGILLSICETEMEQVTSHTSEQQQTGNGNFRFQVGLKPTKMYKRALSCTYSSLPTPSQLFGVFHSTIQGSGNVPQRFRCLESCLTALCSWDTRASTSEVTSLLLGGHTVKLSAAFGCRRKRESIAHHHHVAIFGYKFVATLRDTATCSRCSLDAQPMKFPPF